MTMMMAYQLITTSHIPTRWESVIMMKGGNMTQSHSHHTVCDDTQNLNDTESEFFSDTNFFQYRI